MNKINYKALQQEVFDWLKSKYDKNHNFTFSVRQKANKGAELNYFIGTEKSKYFSTTFWFIPVAYPGSSGDLINLVFDLRPKSGMEFFIQFNQTKKPHDEQNALALELIRNIKKRVEGKFEHMYIGSDTNKMEFFGVYSTPKFQSFDEAKEELEIMMNAIIPIVDEEITLLKSQHPEFIAHRFTADEQEKMFQKMEERFNKYKIVEQLDEELDAEEEKIFISAETEDFRPPLNQILFGPPGTGKTYSTITKAVRIANPQFNINLDRSKIKEEYQRLVNAGQIMFTTFHQSMSYEDFVEGIKPLVEEDEKGEKKVIYEVQKGLFRKICDQAKKQHYEVSEVIQEYSFEDAYPQLISEVLEHLEENNPLVLPLRTSGMGMKCVDVSSNGNLIVQPANTVYAREYTVSYSRAEKLQKAFPDLSIVRNIDKEFREVIGGSNSSAYWAVINYINQKIKHNNSTKTENKLLPQKPHVLIIDEINRGNVSQIFGELITLLEEDKRKGNDEELEVVLAYSKETFSVPANLHVIGTMNTADRSVEALDSALRRRFVFEEIAPDYDLPELDYKLYDFKVAEVLEKINLRIEKLLDQEHIIGHAYFIGKDESTIIDSFYRNIIPLLQEYFFGDFGKIGLVLGKGFVSRKTQNSVFASFDYDNSAQYDETEIFEITDLRDNHAGFSEALQLLMN